MSPSKLKGLAVTERDKSLFYYLFQDKVADNSHLRKDIFSGASKQAVHRRLNKLISHGFIEATYRREGNNKLIYSLSKKALLKFIGDRADLKCLQRKSSSIAHDLGLLEIKRKLLKLSTLDTYFSENTLVTGIYDQNETVKDIRTINPDAILKLKLGNNVFYFPLEYEASAKFAKRYDKLITRYYLLEEAKAILFISKDIQIQKKVIAAEKRRRKGRSGKFFYCLYDDLIAQGTKAQFINNQKEVLLIGP